MINQKSDRVKMVAKKLKGLTIPFNLGDIDLVDSLTASEITTLKNMLKDENPNMATAIYRLKLPYPKHLKFEIRRSLIAMALIIASGQDK